MAHSNSPQELFCSTMLHYSHRSMYSDRTKCFAVAEGTNRHRRKKWEGHVYAHLQDFSDLTS